VERVGRPARWRVFLVGGRGEVTVTGGRMVPADDGVLVEMDAEARRCVIRLESMSTVR
jgi:hypothetical protein